MPDVEVFEIPDVAETLDDVAGDVRVVPVQLPDLPQNLLRVAFVEVGVEQLPDVLVQRRPHLPVHLQNIRKYFFKFDQIFSRDHLTRLWRRHAVVGVLYHGRVSAVQRHGGLLPQHLLEVDLGSAMTVGRSVEERSAGLEQGAGHLDVVVGEVKEQLLDAEECVHLGEDPELGHLPDEPAHLQLGLDVDLILLPDMPAEVLLQQSRQLIGHLW